MLHLQISYKDREGLKGTSVLVEVSRKAILVSQDSSTNGAHIGDVDRQVSPASLPLPYTPELSVNLPDSASV